MIVKIKDENFYSTCYIQDIIDFLLINCSLLGYEVSLFSLRKYNYDTETKNNYLMLKITKQNKTYCISFCYDKYRIINEIEILYVYNKEIKYLNSKGSLRKNLENVKNKILLNQ